jgi:hypothetical protein
LPLPISLLRTLCDADDPPQISLAFAKIRAELALSALGLPAISGPLLEKCASRGTGLLWRGKPPSTNLFLDYFTITLPKDDWSVTYVALYLVLPFRNSRTTLFGLTYDFASNIHREILIKNNI